MAMNSNVVLYLLPKGHLALVVRAKIDDDIGKCLHSD